MYRGDEEYIILVVCWEMTVERGTLVPGSNRDIPAIKLPLCYRSCSTPYSPLRNVDCPNSQSMTWCKVLNSKFVSWSRFGPRDSKLVLNLGTQICAVGPTNRLDRELKLMQTTFSPDCTSCSTLNFASSPLLMMQVHFPATLPSEVMLIYHTSNMNGILSTDMSSKVPGNSEEDDIRYVSNE